jgi:hypothetical protein
MTDDSNPFEQLAQQQMVQAFKRKHKRREAKLYQRDSDAPMVPGEQDKKQRDQQRMYRSYRRHKRAEIRALLEGQYRIPFLRLSRVLRRMTIEDGAALVEHVEQAQWMVEADRLTRYIVLAAISDKIVKLRIQNGYAPFDDSLPGELPTAYEIIRAKLSA